MAVSCYFLNYFHHFGKKYLQSASVHGIKHPGIKHKISYKDGENHQGIECESIKTTRAENY